MTDIRTLTPYDTGKRAEPKAWLRSSALMLAQMEPIERELEEDRYGKVDFEDENGDDLFTIWVETNEAGHPVVHIQQIGPTPVAIRIHGEG